MAAPLGVLVSNIVAGPDTPRASMLIRESTDRASGSRAANAPAPFSPNSSPSLNRKVTGRAGGLLRSSAATSSRVATPIPSSAAPGPAGELS